MKRGPKPQATNVFTLRGTRPKRPRKAEKPRIAFVEPVKPKWLMGQAAKIWDQKVAVYRARGQDVAEYATMLAVYCQSEARLIECHRFGIPVRASMFQQHRLMAAEFFDTPASRIE